MDDATLFSSNLLWILVEMERPVVCATRFLKYAQVIEYSIAFSSKVCPARPSEIIFSER